MHISFPVRSLKTGRIVANLSRHDLEMRIVMICTAAERAQRNGQFAFARACAKHALGLLVSRRLGLARLTRA